MLAAITTGRVSELGESDELFGAQRVFTWAKVDRDLIEALLLARKTERERPLLKAELQRASTEAVRKTAADVFGQAGFDRMRDVVEVLRDEWLRRSGSEVQTAIGRITRDVEEQIGIAGTLRSAHGLDRQRAFLLGCHPDDGGWSTFERSVVREFRYAHRSDLGRRSTRRPLTASEPLVPGFMLQGDRARKRAQERVFNVRPYQQEAWANLDKLARSGRPLRARVVLPTGAGKTDLAVRWIVGQLAKDSKLRVLWLCHQVFLLEQAAFRFRDVVESTQPESFNRELRIFSHGRSPLSQLHEDRTVVALATMNTIAAALKQPRRSSGSQYVRSFLHGPLIVVIDEAHHAGNNSYTRIIKEIDSGRVRRRLIRRAPHHLIGLTATPWPGGTVKQRRFEAAFPDTAIEKSPDDLNEFLAEYSIMPLPSRTVFRLTEWLARDWERRQDPPNAVLRLVGENDQRNRAIVEHYMQHRHEWGRTLIFAPTLRAAAALRAALRDLDVDVRRVDSRSGEVLDAEFRRWFDDTEEAVVVSVAMLLEGVDLPLARTALIARPTSSSVVLRQMFGRVLRRVEGQKDRAIVAYVQDEWAVDGRFEAILKAETPWTSGDDPPQEDAEFEVDVAEALARAISDLEDPESRLSVERRTLLGVYITAKGELIPVLDNQETQLAEFIRRLASDPQARYDHGEEAPPEPAGDLLEALRAHMREHPGDPPKLESIERPLAPVDVAQRLIAEPGADAERQQTILNEAYAASPIAGELYPDWTAFEQAVRRAELEQRRGVVIPERAVVEAQRTPLPEDPRRDLKPLWQEVWATGQRRLDAIGRPVHPIENYDVDWTERPVRSFWAHWKLCKTPGKHRIRVNRRLKTTTELVPDDVLKLLLWHELIHSVTISHGHDLTFTALEEMWPAFLDTNARLDDLDAPGIRRAAS